MGAKLQLRTKLLNAFPWMTIKDLSDLFSISDKNQRVVKLGILRTTLRPILKGHEIHTYVSTHTAEAADLKSDLVCEFLKRQFHVRERMSREHCHQLLKIGCSGLCHNPDTHMTTLYIALIFAVIESMSSTLEAHANPNVLVATVSGTDTGYTLHKSMACNTL